MVGLGLLLAATLGASSPQPQDDAAADMAAPPRRSVLIVEVGQGSRYLGDYIPLEARGDEDFLPFYHYLEVPVVVERRLSGPSYGSRTRMVHIAHADYIPGIRLLVIVEPRREGRGFFVNWKTTSNRGRFCVAEAIVAELDLRRAFARARRRSEEGTVFLCIRD